MLGYGYLLVAIILEVCGTVCMKLSDGFTNTLPSIGTYVFYGLCFWVFSIALKTLEVSIAYAIWSGVGTALIAAIGIAVFKEDLNWLKVVSLLFIVAGVVGLQYSSAMH
ncbi:MAG TPA: multidrug efflux SMR transporter [Candidatus Hydrogenedentes bacterium]|nr:multidrug efflux SMR transporter [Candidatus Hydrogenedentota bacterium]